MCVVAMVTLSSGFNRLLGTVRGQRQFVQVLCEGGGSPVLRPGPAPPPVPPGLVLAPRGGAAATVGHPGNDVVSVAGHAGGRTRREAGGDVGIQVSVLGDRLRESGCFQGRMMKAQVADLTFGAKIVNMCELSPH